MLTSLLFIGVAGCVGGPDSAAVLRRVDALRGPGHPPVAWVLSFAPAGVELTLTAVAEGETFRRELPADPDCDALVEASAVVVLMLESDLAEAVEAKRIVRKSNKSPAPVVPRKVAALSSFDVGLGQGVMLNWPLAWKLVARASWRAPESRFGFGGHVRFQAPRTQRTGLLEVTATRLEARFGPEFTLHPGQIDLVIAAELAGGPLWLRGESTLGSADFATWDLGGAATLRVAPVQWSGFKPWVEVSIVGWGRRHQVRVEGTSYAATVPVVEADLIFGISWGR